MTGDGPDPGSPAGRADEPRFERDVSWRRPRDRRLLIGGSPPGLLRFVDSATAALDRIEHDGTCTDSALADHLVRRGLLHRRAAAPGDRRDLTVVVPAFVRDDDDQRRLRALVSSLAPLRVVVVDDCSPVPVAGDSACTVIRREHNGGPAAARNSGLASVTGPHVAFVDMDCTFDPRCAGGDADDGPALLLGLATHLRDPEVAVVAPRVRSATGRGVLARYEAISSPLDMGPHRSRVRLGSRLSHVPAAVLVARTSALLEIGGFDESFRRGEDVDLLWRLDARGLRCLYDPSFVAGHAPRRSIPAMLGQRFGYGLSAAPLARRHRHVAYRGGALATAGLVAIAFGWPFAAAGAGALALSTLLACGRLGRHGVDPFTAASLSARGHLSGAGHLARVVTREWLPFALALALLDRRAAMALGAAWVVPAIADWVRGVRAGVRADPLSTIVLRSFDHAAYAAGVWTGMVRAHSPTAIRPSLRLSA